MFNSIGNSREGCVTKCEAKIFKQLRLSVISENPSETCSHCYLYILLFMGAHLNKPNSPHFTEKWHFLSTTSKTNKYPLQKMWVFPMMSRSYTCFLKRCMCHALVCAGLCCLCLALGTPRQSSHHPRMLSMGCVQYRNICKRFAKSPISSTRLLWNVCKLFRYWTQPWQKQSGIPECMFGCILQHDQSCPKLTSICYKFSRAEEHVTKYILFFIIIIIIIIIICMYIIFF